MSTFSVRHLLRSIGLGILSSIARRRRRATKDSISEPKKYIKSSSFWVALQRCMVHLLPSAASITIIALNLKGFFIGFELAGIPGHDAESNAALQVTAKLQELLIVASVATVVFHKLREDMLRKKGLPFGLLGSGLSFTTLSFLWSPEFIVGVGHGRKNRTLCCLVIVSAIIAALAGPATAVLLIPSTITYAAGGTYFYINGTKDALWPSVVRLDHYLPNYTNVFGESVACSSSESYKSALCPSGGFQSLLQHFAARTLRTRAGTPILDPDPNRLFSHTVRGGIIMQSPNGKMAAQTISGQVRGEDITETFAYATHGTTTALQMPLNQDWVLAAENAKNMYASSRQISRLRFYSIQESTVLSQVPAVRVLCLGQQIGPGSPSIAFPALPEFENAINPDGQVLRNHTILFNNMAARQDGDVVSHLWTDIRKSISINESISQGFVLNMPLQQNSSGSGIACSIDARWADATVWQRFPGPFQASFVHTRPATNGFRGTSFLPKNDSSWRRIQFDPSWVSALDFPFNFSSADATWRDQTSIPALITVSGILEKLASLDPTAIAFLEYIIATTFSDALSRASSYRSYLTSPDTRISDWPLLNYNATPTTPDIRAWSRAIPPKDIAQTNSTYTRMHMKQTVTGFGYSANGPADYLAIMVLLAHLIIAISHTVYVLGFRHQTSGCWDTFAEFMVLAQQSLPAEGLLENTCAGIRRASVFRTKVRIRISKEDQQHLELEYDSDYRTKELESESEIDLGENYG
ncbi:hypothetical protein EJ08DRAFT_649888 [Tothia fuscella]|uniref:Uncharacterized protein n=1 Tax=Tothia fuscella TaxID=1048955 RepID=A0A9P4NR24_9PEZI|nr:hypothetical protein EJ08DRAFT_649888 [Tothia fuscella]